MKTSLLTQIRAAGLPVPEEEYPFRGRSGNRRWRFDFAWVDRKLCVEVDGGLYVKGRHVRGREVERDMVKRAEALCMGWRILICSPRHVASGQALAWVIELLGGAS